MSIQDEYAQRIDSYDRALWAARQRERSALRRTGRNRDAEDHQGKTNVRAVIEHYAKCAVTPERLAVIEADAARERAMQAWEHEMDAEDAQVRYGLIPKPRKELTPGHDGNVIRVDFASRTRAPRTSGRQAGR